MGIGFEPLSTSNRTIFDTIGYYGYFASLQKFCVIPKKKMKSNRMYYGYNISYMFDDF